MKLPRKLYGRDLARVQLTLERAFVANSLREGISEEAGLRPRKRGRGGEQHSNPLAIRRVDAYVLPAGEVSPHSFFRMNV